MLRRPVVFVINWYQKNIRAAFNSSCRYMPSCSEYTKQAIEKYGVLKGICKGIGRIMRCSPYSRTSGYDPLQ